MKPSPAQAEALTGLLTLTMGVVTHDQWVSEIHDYERAEGGDVYVGVPERTAKALERQGLVELSPDDWPEGEVTRVFFTPLGHVVALEIAAEQVAAAQHRIEAALA